MHEKNYFYKIMTKDMKEWECLGGAIYSVLHEAALEVVILDNGLISKVEIYYLYKHSIFFRYLLKVVLLFTSPQFTTVL